MTVETLYEQAADIPWEVECPDSYRIRSIGLATLTSGAKDGAVGLVVEFQEGVPEITYLDDDDLAALLAAVIRVKFGPNQESEACG